MCVSGLLPDLGAHGLPVPGIPAHIEQGALGRPAEHGSGQSRVCVAGRGIAGAAGANLVGNVNPGCVFKRMNQLKHRIPCAGAKINGVGASVPRAFSTAAQWASARSMTCR